jgi:hypothetical protein
VGARLLHLDGTERRSGTVRKKETALVMGKRQKGTEVLNFLFFSQLLLTLLSITRVRLSSPT